MPWNKRSDRYGQPAMTWPDLAPTAIVPLKSHPITYVVPSGPTSGAAGTSHAPSPQSINAAIPSSAEPPTTA